MSSYPSRPHRFVPRCALASMCGLMAIVTATTSARGQCDPQEQTKLIASDSANDDVFGYSVAVSGDTAIVGAENDSHAGGAEAGSAYVFVRANGVWTQQVKLIASDAAATDEFGYWVAISGDTAVVGAWSDDNAGGADAGSAYVFVRSGTVWTEQQKLTASDAAANDWFGISVAISGDTIVVGAQKDDNAGGADAGSAYVFVRSGTTWTEQQKLIASDAAAQDAFAATVGINGDTAVVGADGNDDACPMDVNCNSGSAYVFVRSGTFWVEQAKLSASDAAKEDYFGYGVAVSGDSVVIGATGDDNASGVDRGSAYVFTRTGTVWTQQQILIASDGAEDDYFGISVSLSDDTALIGADSANAGGVDVGSAYVFVRSGTVWTEQDKLIASDAAEDDYFGTSVAISGDTAVVGSYADDHSDKTDNGSAYAFDLNCDDDGDGTVNANDGCPADANKIAPGNCGCGVADVDTNGNGISDCLDGAGSACCAPGAAPTVGVLTPLVMMAWKIRRRRKRI